MRVVLDTNVLARAIVGRKGPAGEVLLRSIQPPHLLVVSPFILMELARVLRYERMRLIHRLDDAALDQELHDIQTASLLVVPPLDAPRVVLADPDDDFIIHTAIAGQAEALCTLDKHFSAEAVLTFCRQQKMEILSDQELLTRLRS